MVRFMNQNINFYYDESENLYSEAMLATDIDEKTQECSIFDVFISLQNCSIHCLYTLDNDNNIDFIRTVREYLFTDSRKSIAFDVHPINDPLMKNPNDAETKKKF